MIEKPRYTSSPGTAKEMIENWSGLINEARGESAKCETRLEIDEMWHVDLEAVQTMKFTNKQLRKMHRRWHDWTMTERDCRNRLIERLLAVREELLL